MVNTAYKFNRCLWLSSAALLGATCVAFGSQAIAQTPGASLLAVPPTPARMATDKPYRGPPPVVMFRATPNPAPASNMTPEQGSDAPSAQPVINFVDPPPLVQADPEPRRYSIANTAERDAQNAGWDPANTDAVIAPAMVATGKPSAQLRQGQSSGDLTALRGYRSPMRRILQDTGRSITRDLPEAVADALPWVDRDAKNEPFDDVLGRVADDLHRAAQGDPAWALPAQREIRALSQRLDMLPAPPPLSAEALDARPVSIAAGIDDRPFRPRPIWPGASGRLEVQVRPVTLVTATSQQAGPRVAGVVARYVPAVEDDDGMPVIAQTPSARPRASRGSAARGVPKARTPAN